ncbi:MAG TPA: CocE/NonD family hydrolase, partial [Solirubrobacteraceae bacterium]|nr:CocE/NonD family hydrolase [Solirubrobacteraceae bacterium]
MRSFDGTSIVTHFYPASRAPAGGRAATVLVGSGFPHRGDTRPDLDASDQIGAATLRRAGYNVLTWDPRGLGGSGGTVMFDSADHEARDVASLIDFVARQPEALLDAAGDPRVGMSGRSYGAGIQLVSAAIDPRIDAIVPDLAWHSLVTSFFKDGAVKAGWLTLVCGGGEVAALTGGLFFTPGGLQLGGTATEMKRACLEAIAGGAISAASRRWIADRGPGDLVDRIRAPTLIVQGTVDPLFSLDEAIANYERLRSNGVPVKMVWYCGGHGACPTPVREPRRVARAALAWLDRWLKRSGAIDTGPAFEWIADDGIWRAAPDFPLAPAGALAGVGAGKLSILPLAGVDARLIAPPVPTRRAADVRFSAARVAGDVVGAPRVKLTYHGTAVPARTLLYAQVVDAVHGRVAGAQVTPLPVVLDGRTRTVERPLETLALRVGPASDLRLQITAGTTVYGPQRSLGNVRLRSIEASLPLVDGARAGRASNAGAGLRTPRRLRISPSSRRVRGRSRIVLRSRLRTRPCSGTVGFTIRAGSTRRTARATIAPTCAVRAVVRLRAPAGRTARIAARFEGNQQLAPRRARSV